MSRAPTTHPNMIKDVISVFIAVRSEAVPSLSQLCSISLGAIRMPSGFLEFLSNAHPERAALETILSHILVKAVNVNREKPGDIGQTELSADGMDLIEGAACGASGIMTDLPRVVTGWSNFGE